MAAHGRGLAGSGEPTVARPYWPTPLASASPNKHKAMERGGDKGPKWHDHVRARLHGENGDMVEPPSR
jgi:hypothetical protein